MILHVSFSIYNILWIRYLPILWVRRLRKVKKKMLKVIQPIKGRVRIWRQGSSIPSWDLCIRPHYPLLLWAAKIGWRWSWSWRYPRNNLRLSPSFPCFTLCRRWCKGTASASFLGEQREWKVQGVLGASGFSRDQFWSPWLSETV